MSPENQMRGISCRGPLAAACRLPSGSRLKSLGAILLCVMGVGVAKWRIFPHSASAGEVAAIMPAVPDRLAAPASAAPPPATQEADVPGLIVRLSENPPARPAPPLTDDPFQRGDKIAAEGAEDAARQRREAQRQQVLRAVEKLRLSAVLNGAVHRACLINSALVQEGQEVDGFLVEEIAPATVVVRKGAYRFALRISR